MTIFRSSALMLGLVVGSCGLAPFKPRNELEGLLQGNVREVISSLEDYIASHQNEPLALEADLLEAGFSKGDFLADASEFDARRINCQFYNYRREAGANGFGASAVVYLCKESSGANFGYIAP